MSGNDYLDLNRVEPLSMTKDANANISLGGVSLQQLSDKYGDSMYLMCEETIRQRARAYKQVIAENYDNNGLVIYASKAMNCKAICKIIASEGLGIDVVSGGELYTALRAGFPTEKIIFHGNNKSKDELRMAIDNELGAIMLDNLYELSLIEEILADSTLAKKKVNLMVRITPGIECHTHEYITTGMIDSKFGFNLDEIESVFAHLRETVSRYPNISISGLHAHIGSQIFETMPFVDNAKVLMSFYKLAQDKYGFIFTDLNVGGGLGIKYLRSDDPPLIQDTIRLIIDAIKDESSKLGIKEPRLLLEPGRSIVGPAGITVYKVGNIKDIPNVRKYVAVNGGMADNSRPIMYQAEYLADIDGKDRDSNQSEIITIAGKYCESGDILIRDIEMPVVEHGDRVVVYSTGAYNYSMASNYNRVVKPPVILVHNGKAHTIVKGETLDDLIRNDIVPDHLV